MGYRYGISDINGISICVSMCIDVVYGISTWDMVYRYRIWYIDVDIHHMDMIILDIDMGYGISMWEMTVSILS
jgi:hypothetical protein